jgi:hypothetical protein
MTKPLTSLINLPFDQLIPKRDLFGDDTEYFCICKCGSSRTVLRKALLDKTVKACVRCAAERRRKAGGRKPEPPLPPEPVQVKSEAAKCGPMCTLRIERGVLYVCHDPDCRVLNLFPISLLTAKTADTRTYPATVI